MIATLFLAVALFLAASPASRALDGVGPGVKLNPADGPGDKVYQEGLDKRNLQEQEEAGQERPVPRRCRVGGGRRGVA